MEKKTADQHPNAIDMLIADHNKVEKLFNEFKKIKKEGSASEKKEIVQQVCFELTVHAQLEEEVFYPTVRAAIQDDDLMDESLVEHGEAKGIIAQLLELEPSDDLYDARVIVLSENIEHHVKEEQDDMFPKVKKAKIDLNALGEQMKERKAQLQAQYGDLVANSKMTNKNKTASQQARPS